MKYQRNPQTNLQIRIIKKKSLRGRKDFQYRYVYQYLKIRHNRLRGASISISYLPGCSCPGLCKAWQEKIPERSEDDFLLANQPIGLPWAIRRTRTIFAGKKLKYNKILIGKIECRLTR